MESLINQPVTVGFVGTTTGITTFSDFLVLKDGVFILLSPTFTEVGSKLYTVTFTPASTGRYTVFVEGSIQAQVEVVAKTTQSLILDTLDEALGSWSWDKATGVLSLYRQTGTVLATYNIVDNSTTASRERVS